MSFRATKKAKQSTKGKGASTSTSAPTTEPSQAPPGPFVSTTGYRLEWLNDAEARAFRDLRDRPVLTTKFYCQATCRKLGIDATVRCMLENLGWSEFLTRQAHTYPILVHEVGATFKMEQSRTGDYNLTFRLMNEPQSITLSRLNRMFGWNPRNPCVDTDDLTKVGGTWGEFNQNAFWTRITEDTSVMVTSRCRATSIQHPALRYLHRLLAQLLFSRDELGQVRPYELLLMWLATEGNRRGLPQPNYGYILCERLLELNKGWRSSHNITLGGLVTLIALNLGIDPPARHPSNLFKEKEPPLLGFEELRRAGVWRKKQSKNRRCLYLVKGVARCYLPLQGPDPLQAPNVGNPWLVPPGEVLYEDLTDVERQARGLLPEHHAQVGSDEEDDDDDEAEDENMEEAGQETEAHHHVEPQWAPIDPPSLGGGTFPSSSNPTPSPFDMQSLHGAITDLRSEVQGMRSDNNVFFQNTYNALNNFGAEIDVVRRVAWRTYVAGVEGVRPEPFPNYPQYPPSFDPREDNFNDPSPPFPNYPHYPWYPYFPPPQGGNDGGN